MIEPIDQSISSALSGATFSKDFKHRYKLWRRWDQRKPIVTFIGLNPSRADAITNDPTIRRCIDFAKQWGMGGLIFCNLYSFRTPYVTAKQVEVARYQAKYVHDTKTGDDWQPLTENLDHACNEFTDLILKDAIAQSEKTVFAWGS